MLKKLSFGQQKLALYEDQLTIHARLPSALKDRQIINVQVQLQACNEKHCLAPETLSLVGISDSCNGLLALICQPGFSCIVTVN
jgi:hypothetical protein